jgi:hypothetical protein
MLHWISNFSWQSFLGYDADAFHVVVQDRLMAPIVPFQRDPGPVGLGDGGLVILVITPTNPGADA